MIRASFHRPTNTFVRLTATGQLYMCLGQEDMVDLREVLRGAGPAAVDTALDRSGSWK